MIVPGENGYLYKVNTFYDVNNSMCLVPWFENAQYLVGMRLLDW